MVSSAIAGSLPPPLVEGLGFAGLSADTRSAEAQRWFQQGVKWTWAFDEMEAIRSFQKAQEADPACAMCFWGEAWARGPTINLRVRAEELPASAKAASRAAALAGNLPLRTREMIKATQLRASGETAFKTEDYATAMEALAARYPRDDTIAIMAADARMTAGAAGVAGPATRSSSGSPVGQYGFMPNSPTQQLLERVLRRNPYHTGAIHYYIHLMDWIRQPRLGERYADNLLRLAPSASHLVHMSSHTFYGVGRYRDATEANLVAMAVDRAYERRARPPESGYRNALYGHNLHFALGSALMRGDGNTALSVADEFVGRFADPASDAGLRHVIRSSTYFAFGLHRDLDFVLALPEPVGPNPLPKVMRHYARGEALARTGGAAAVRDEAAKIAKIRISGGFPLIGGTSFLTEALAEIAQRVLEGRAAMIDGDHQAAIAAFDKAARLQGDDAFTFDPPPWWYPVRRSLAAAYLSAGDAEAARRQLFVSSQRWPNDPLALYLLAKVEAAAGRKREAARALKAAQRGWTGDLAQVSLSRV